MKVSSSLMRTLSIAVQYLVLFEDPCILTLSTDCIMTETDYGGFVGDVKFNQAHATLCLLLEYEVLSVTDFCK